LIERAGGRTGEWEIGTLRGSGRSAFVSESFACDFMPSEREATLFLSFLSSVEAAIHFPRRKTRRRHLSGPKPTAGVKRSVLGFDNSPENVGGDGSWADWDIEMAGELTPSVRLRLVARFFMRYFAH
jgi:hypothetical protein